MVKTPKLRRSSKITPIKEERERERCRNI